MNVFMILIMAAMLGVYQYFTAKKSSDVTLNKEELAFEAELNCLKQFHDYGAARLEATSNAIVKPNYTCAGNDKITIKKYCLSTNTVSEDCTSGVTDYCVVTYTEKDNLENSLKALLFKKGIGEVSPNYTINKKAIPQGIQVSDKEKTSFGLVSCIPVKQIEEHEKMAGAKCSAKGKYAQQTAEGKWECVETPEVTNCTAHEDETLLKGNRTNCRESNRVDKNNKRYYCCAKTNINCGNNDNIKAEWDSVNHFYKCVDGTNKCKELSNKKTLPVYDENGIEKTSINNIGENFYIAKYDTTTQKWECIPNADILIKKCREATRNANLAYVSVTNLTVSNGTPNCNGASSKSASAVETCSACGIPTLDKDTNQWKCQYPTIVNNEITTLPNNLQWGDYVAIVTQNAKGVDPCFKGCNKDEYSSNGTILDAIKTKRYNGLEWGLTWNEKSKIFECFYCAEAESAGGTSFLSTAYINENCKHGETYATDESTYIKRCSDDTNYLNWGNCDKTKTKRINGKCVLKCCNELYQKRGSNGSCYTKWCRGIPAEANAKINKPNDKECPTDYPRMIYNNKQDCVYCIKLPPISSN